MTAILSFSITGRCERMSETWLTVLTSPDKIKFVVVGWKNDQRFWSNQTTNKLYFFLLGPRSHRCPGRLFEAMTVFMAQRWNSCDFQSSALLFCCEIHKTVKYTESEVLVQSEMRSIIHTYIHFPRLYFAAINMIFKLNLFQFECCFMPAPGYSSREKRGNCSITTQTVTLFLLLSDSFRCQNLTRQRTQVQVSRIWIFPS